MKEERKIQQMGNAYTIYLPSAWVKEQGLTRGTQVTAAAQPDGTLLISTHKAQTEGKAKITAGEGRHPLRKVVSAYIAGASEIMLSGPAAYTVASAARQHLGGVEIVGESNEGFKLKVLVDSNDVSQTELLKRMNTVVTTTGTLMLNAIRTGKKLDQGELEQRDDNTDRLYLMLLRVAYQSRSSFQSIANALAAKSIERIGDHILGINKGTLPQNTKAKHDKLLEKALTLYSTAFDAFINQKDTDPVFNNFDTIKAESAKLAAQNPQLANYTERCRRIAFYATDIAEITDDTLQHQQLQQH